MAFGILNTLAQGLKGVLEGVRDGSPWWLLLLPILAVILSLLKTARDRSAAHDERMAPVGEGEGMDAPRRLPEQDDRLWSKAVAFAIILGIFWYVWAF